MNSQSTQSNIPIAGIKDGIVILKDGQYRIILELSAINFDLKSEQEQNSIIFQYQSFLNSLHFPVQIAIKSQRLDLSLYLTKIKALLGKQSNELIKIQTQDYIDFVSQLINLANIMKKRFYIIVGYQPITVKSGIFDKFFDRGQSNKLKISETDFESYSKELRQRAQTVSQGLGGIGLRCRQLDTKEIIEVMYEIYNPDIAGKERLADPNDVSQSLLTQLKQNNENGVSETRNETGDIIDNKTTVQTVQKRSLQVASRQRQEEPANQNSKPAAQEENLGGNATTQTDSSIGQDQVVQKEAVVSNSQNYGA